MKIEFMLSAVTCVVMTLSACSGRDATSAKESAVADPNTAVTNPEILPTSLDRWLGRWIGPEGTFLVLSKQEDSYGIVIQSLDGQASYEGKRVGEHIEFARNGKTESIRATNGKGTGMKWLQEKTDCLTINLGEGFCRDATSAALSEPSAIGK